MTSFWLDAHLDLACLALLGRDMSAHFEHATGHPQPAALTLHSLDQANVRVCIASLFSAPNAKAPYGYDAAQPTQSFEEGRKQLQIYQQWARQGLCSLIKNSADLMSSRTPLNVLLSFEGADPIRTPEEVAWWFAQGVRLVGLSWKLGTQYAGGNQTQVGLMPAAFALLEALERHGMIHDLSHLSEIAFNELLANTKGPVVASHSNSRRLLQSDDPRHLSDAQIKAIRRREGMIGVNLLNQFLHPQGLKVRAHIDDVVDHIEYLCRVMQSRKYIGLGSDIDGGYGAQFLPVGIRSHADLELLCETLNARGWTDSEIQDFRADNWLRFLQHHLPQT
ncbi:MAG: membrane dipeptidase [Myxococcota bacterium]